MLTTVGRRVPADDAERPSVAAQWFAVYVVVSVARVTELLPFAHSLPLAKLVFAVVLVATFRGRRVVSPIRLWSIDLARAATVFVALVVLSLGFSVWMSHTLSFITGPFLTIGLGFFVAVKILARWSDIRVVLKAFAVVGLILSAEAVAGYSGGRAVVESMYDTNDLAYVLMGVLPIAMAFGVISHGVWRIYWFGIAGVIAIAGLLTQSRGGLLAVGAIVLLLVWKPLRGPDLGAGTRARSRGLLVRALLAAVLSVAVWTQLPPDAQHRLGLLFSLQDDYNADLSVEGGRSAIWRRNVIAGLERPIGYGVDTFEFVDGTISGRYKAPHNSIVQVFVELGVLGLIFWLRLWFLSWRSLAPPAPAAAVDPRAAEELREQTILAHALRISLVALFISGFFLSQAYSLILWQILPVCAAMSVVFGTNAKRMPAVPRRRHYTALP
jgi:hypothetical protein